MGGESSKEQERKRETSPPKERKRERSPPKELDDSWRPVNWSEKEKILKDLKDLKPHLETLRILLHGPVGAGKSSFINTVQRALIGHNVISALESSTESETFTLSIKTHKMQKLEGGYHPFVFCDVMGLESDKTINTKEGCKERRPAGIQTEDIIKVLEGHISDGYEFDAQKPITEDHPNYKEIPDPCDKIHCLISIGPADAISRIDHSVIEKMKTVRKKASELNMPQVIVLTKVDKACELVSKDLRKLYYSRKIKEKVEVSSHTMGISVNNIYPVKNYHEEVTNDENIDVIILQALRDIFYFANDYAREIYPPSLPPELDDPWRPVNWSEKEEIFKDLEQLNKTVEPPRILLYGPIGAGKSCFINSVQKSLIGRNVISAVVGSAESGESLTVSLKTHKMKKRGGGRYPFVFCDIMGLEPDSGGIQTEDIIKVLEGHILDDYEFDPQKPITDDNPMYKQCPEPCDKIHCLVSIVPADAISRMDYSVTEKMKAVRKQASELNIPQVIVLTKVDKACEVVSRDLTRLYHSRKIREKVEVSSHIMGIPMNNIYPVKNYHEEVTEDENIDVIILKALRDIFYCADDYAREIYPPSPPPELDDPWRPVNWSEKEEIFKDLEQLNKTVEPPRILLYGPIGAGKSCFINSVQKSLIGRNVISAVVGSAESGESLTVSLKTHKMKKRGGGRYPFVFCDIMGLEPDSGGIQTEDIIKVLEGHILDDYEFDPQKPITDDNPMYKQCPEPCDKIHCLVSIVPADAISRMDYSVTEKMKAVRKQASELNIPQVIVLTKVDKACEVVSRDLTRLYHSRKIREKVEVSSHIMGIPMNNIYPVKNYHEEVTEDENIDVIILKALRDIFYCADDYAREIYPPSPPPELDDPWRPVNWSEKEEIFKDLEQLNKTVEPPRILLYGPIGAGKSCFINSVQKSLIGRNVISAVVGSAESGESFTVSLKTHKMKKRGGGRYPFVFCDIMGLEPDSGGIQTEDIIKVLEGHILDDYEFDPQKPITDDNPMYKQCPEPCDKIHCLVSIVPADAISRMDYSVTEKMKAVRKQASELNIPQVIVLTKVDKACEVVSRDLTRLYHSRKIREKVEVSSHIIGIPMNYIYPVKNYHEEVTEDENIDVIILKALRDIFYCANDYAREIYPPSLLPELDGPWRPVNWSEKEEIFKDLEELNKTVEPLRILLCGPVGAGKSCFINSVQKSLIGRNVISAVVGSAESGESFTVSLKTHKMKNRGGERYPFVFCDIMGLEPDSGGIQTEDIIKVLEGHILDDYEFDPQKPITDDNPMYKQCPEPCDKIHCLVSIVPADAISRMDYSVIEKMKAVRKKASKRNIPQVIVLTKVDKACEVVSRDLTRLYHSRKIREKVEVSSHIIGIPMNYIYPVKNYHEEVTEDENIDVIILKALRDIFYCANDYAREIYPPSLLPELDGPWRPVNWSEKEEIFKDLEQLNKTVEPLRILLYGPVGAGKSCFINSVQKSLIGRNVISAVVGSTASGESFTVSLKKHKMKKRGGGRYPFVFCDIMGLEPDSGGIQTEDIIKVLEGHILDDYKFDPQKPITDDNPKYKQCPEPCDKIHCLVSIVPADAISRMDYSVTEKMKAVRKQASELNIPQVTVLTKVDKACEVVSRDLTRLYHSRKIREKLEQSSHTLGIPLDNIYPMKNYHAEVNKDDSIDVIILMALRNIVYFASDNAESLCDDE